MKQNFLQMQGMVETKPVIRKVIEVINEKKNDGMFKDTDVAEIEIRKYILADLIERFGSWKEEGDCLPVGVPISKKKIANVIIEEREDG